MNYQKATTQITTREIRTMLLPQKVPQPLHPFSVSTLSLPLKVNSDPVSYGVYFLALHLSYIT